jgi:hypothetical protein
MCPVKRNVYGEHESETKSIFSLSLICNRVGDSYINISDFRAKPFERQRYLPTHRQNESFLNNNMQRRLFAWRRLKVGQYVTQSGLYLHHSEPHSSDEN